MVTGYVTSALRSWHVLTFHASEEYSWDVRMGCQNEECSWDGISIPETTDTKPPIQPWTSVPSSS